MKTAKEILDSKFNELFLEDWQLNNILEAMNEYAQQFIDVGNDIIIPATDILPDTYDGELKQWNKITAEHLKELDDEHKI